MTIKETKNQLQKGNVEFTVKGITQYQRGGENNEWGYFPKIFKVGEDADSIHEQSYIRGMNVNKWGPTCVTLFTYDMLGKRTTGKIKYSEITIID